MRKGRKKKHNPKWVRAWLILMSVFIAELFFYTWCRVQNVRIGYEIAEAADNHEHLVTLQKNLKIELARLKSPERISKIARSQLGLINPKPKQVVIIP